MNRLVNKHFFGFSIRKLVYESLYATDTTTQAYRVTSSSMQTSVPGVEPLVSKPNQPSYTATKLSSGLTVLTQSAGYPSNIQLGIMIDMGTRDEDGQSSGSLLSLKNTYLKTAINTNETVNYGIAQMAGGQFEMTYNRQNAFYRVNCLAHDVIDVFSMLSDCAFEPKNYVSAGVGMYKNQQFHKLEAHLGNNTAFNDAIYATAFGNKNLGNPINGRRNNVGNLSTYVLQRFQSLNITPKRVVISATGVENHQQFQDLVADKMSTTILSNNNSDRASSQYKGGQVRNLLESNNIHICVAFQGTNHKNALPLLLAKYVLGYNRQTGRVQKNILNKHAFVDNVQPFSANFTDNGLFGLKVSGSAAHASEILNATVNQVNGLRTISQKELALAKRTLLGTMDRQFTRNYRRLEERSKQLYYLGNTGQNYAQEVNSVTVAEVQNAVSNALRTPLTLAIHGGQANTLSSYDKISAMFQ